MVEGEQALQEGQQLESSGKERKERSMVSQERAIERGMHHPLSVQSLGMCCNENKNLLTVILYRFTCLLYNKELPFVSEQRAIGKQEVLL